MNCHQITRQIAQQFLNPTKIGKRSLNKIQSHNEVIKVCVTRNCAIQTNSYVDKQQNYSYYNADYNNIRKTLQPTPKLSRYNSYNKKRLLSLFKKPKQSRSSNPILFPNSRNSNILMAEKYSDKLYNFINSKIKPLAPVCQRIKAKNQYSRSFLHSHTQTNSTRAEYGLIIRHLPHNL